MRVRGFPTSGRVVLDVKKNLTYRKFHLRPKSYSPPVVRCQVACYSPRRWSENLSVYGLIHASRSAYRALSRAAIFRTGELLSANSSHNVSQVAARYASALLDLAIEKNALDQTEAEMTAFGQAIADIPELLMMLTTPTLSAEHRMAVVSEVGTNMGVSDLVSNFLGLVAESRRTAELPSMVRAFRELSQDYRGVTRASVTSAHELTDAQIKELQDLVAGVSGGEVSMDVKVEPALIAGFQLKIGSRLVDASVKTKLDRMNLAMKGA